MVIGDYQGYAGRGAKKRYATIRRRHTAQRRETTAMGNPAVPAAIKKIL